MLAKSHSINSKAARKAKKTPASLGMPTLTEKYNRVDDTISLVYVDIANGVSRSDCLEKIQLGQYGNKPIKQRQAALYYNAALDRFAVDCDIEAEKLRKVFYGRYETILAECMKNGDMYNARATLDSMAKIFLGIDKKENNIEIKNNSDGITIKFGFSNNEEEVKEAEFEEV